MSFENQKLLSLLILLLSPAAYLTTTAATSTKSSIYTHHLLDKTTTANLYFFSLPTAWNAPLIPTIRPSLRPPCPLKSSPQPSSSQP